jgi:putative SOS response-associated peptidase YedK
MCGRYRLSRRKRLIEEYFASVSGEQDWNPRYNIVPTQPVPVIRQKSQGTSSGIVSVLVGTHPVMGKRSIGCCSDD